MKKRVGVFTLAVIVVSFFCVTTASAGANAEIKGPKEVYAGEEYTYTYTVSFSSCTEGKAKVSAEGVFEIDSGGKIILLPISSGSNSGTYSETVTVRVKNDAQPGQTGKIIVKVEYQEVGEESEIIGNVDFKEKYTAAVVSKPAANKPKKTSKPKQTKVPETPAPDTAAPETPVTDIAAAPADKEPLLSSIEALTPGSVLKLPAQQAACLSRDVLLALKKSGAALNVDFGKYTCTVEGKSVGELPDDFSQIDLSVSTVKKPSLSAAANGLDEYQLHFAYSGDLPCPLKYSFPVSGHSPGETLYLYYYYELSDVIEGKRQAVVDENGYVSFDIYHCSSYFITSQLLSNAAGVLNTPAKDDSADIDVAVQALLRAKALEAPSVTITELIFITLSGIAVAAAITAIACRKVWGGRAG